MKRISTLIGHVLSHYIRHVSEGLVRTVLEGSLEGRNCKVRLRLEYMRQPMEKLIKYAEVKRLV